MDRPPDCRRLAALFATLSDPTRIHVLLELGDGERTVGGIAAATGRSIPSVSRHLVVLRAAGLVESRRDGQRRIYALRGAGRVGLRIVRALGG